VSENETSNNDGASANQDDLDPQTSRALGFVQMLLEKQG
jgi:hypothetical protein